MSERANRLRVGPTTIDFLRLRDAAKAIASGELRGAIHLCNAYTLALADERPELATMLNADAANLPDGMPLVWWAKRHGISDAERVYGPDLIQAVLDFGSEHDPRRYLYGSYDAHGSPIDMFGYVCRRSVADSGAVQGHAGTQVDA